MADPFIQLAATKEKVARHKEFIQACCRQASNNSRFYLSRPGPDSNELTIQVMDSVTKKATRKINVTFVFPEEENIKKFHFGKYESFSRWLSDEAYLAECQERTAQGLKPYKRDIIN